jgi:hypothetical protein
MLVLLAASAVAVVVTGPLAGQVGETSIWVARRLKGLRAELERLSSP